MPPLIDPTGGIGYGVRERLPSADMTTLATQAPRALDIVDGGTFDVGGAVILQDDGGSVSVECPWSFDDNTWPLVNSRIVTRSQPLGSPLYNTSSRFSFDTAEYHWYQSDITSAGGIAFPMTALISGASMTGVTFRFDGNLNGAGHSNFPATMPSVAVVRSNDTGTFDTIGCHTLDSAADFASTIATYDGAWNYTLTFGAAESMTLNQPRSYYLVIAGEASTNSVTWLTLIAAVALFTVTEIRI